MGKGATKSELAINNKMKKDRSQVYVCLYYCGNFSMALFYDLYDSHLSCHDSGSTNCCKNFNNLPLFHTLMAQIIIWMVSNFPLHDALTASVDWNCLPFETRLEVMLTNYISVRLIKNALYYYRGIHILYY